LEREREGLRSRKGKEKGGSEQREGALKERKGMLSERGGQGGDGVRISNQNKIHFGDQTDTNFSTVPDS
jgi:hypothetical protein